MLLGEIFSNDIKGPAGSISATINWILAFIVTKSFTNLRDFFGIGATFFIFSGLSLLGTVFIFFVVPETKGKSFQEIQNELEDKQM